MRERFWAAEFLAPAARTAATWDFSTRLGRGVKGFSKRAKRPPKTRGATPRVKGFLSCLSRAGRREGREPWPSLPFPPVADPAPGIIGLRQGRRVLSSSPPALVSDRRENIVRRCLGRRFAIARRPDDRALAADGPRGIAFRRGRAASRRPLSGEKVKTSISQVPPSYPARSPLVHPR